MSETKETATLERLGLDISGHSGSELICTCPGCGKKEHFYFNVQRNLGHCKVCDEGLNFLQTLAKLVEQRQEDTSSDELQPLADDRKLPLEAFDGYGIFYDDNAFQIPVYGTTGNLTSLRYYQIGRGIRTHGGCNAAIFGAQRLENETQSEDPVYLCEGEWDAIALEWLRRRAGEPGVVVGVPGAGIFKDAWVKMFTDRSVYIGFDNDNAGEKGCQKVISKIRSKARKIFSFQWHSNDAEGMDLRDLITNAS